MIVRSLFLGCFRRRIYHRRIHLNERDCSTATAEGRSIDVAQDFGRVRAAKPVHGFGAFEQARALAAGLLAAVTGLRPAEAKPWTNASG